MSDDDDSDDSKRLPLLLECEDCRATFPPDQFGAATASAVHRDARCPRCGGDLTIADPN